MSDVYHLALTRGQIEGARHVLLPGDPGRVMKLARSLDPQAVELAWKREYRTALAHVDGRAVLVTSTGIGGPSASIAVDELAQLGVRWFLRVGTCGAIQPSLALGDVVITTAAVRFDGASTHYAPIEFPAVADHRVVRALVDATHDEGIRCHVGITASTDTFYPGQERTDSFANGLLRRFHGQTDELRRLGVLNYEMESATVLTMCAALGLAGGCVTGVVGERSKGDSVTAAGLAAGESNVVRIAVTATRRMLTLAYD